MITYCTICFLPTTKPDLYFDKSGVCAACIAYRDRKVSLGEAQDLNPKYNPDRVVGGYKKNGKSYPKTQGAALSSSVQQRKKKRGM